MIHIWFWFKTLLGVTFLCLDVYFLHIKQFGIALFISLFFFTYNFFQLFYSLGVYYNFYDTIIITHRNQTIQISTIPTENCSICFEQLDPISELYRIIPCKHWYHSRCILQWAEQSNTCPLCRRTIYLYQKIDIGPI